MRIKPRELLIALFAAAGCTTDMINGDESLLVTNGDHSKADPWIQVGGSVPAWAGRVRVKINGRYLVAEDASHSRTYLEIWGGVHSEVTGQLDPGTATAEVELVGDDGQTLLHTSPLPLSRPSPLFLWVHDSAAGLVGETPDAIADDAPETAEIRAVNISGDQRITFYRCVGRSDCPGCYTMPDRDSGRFAPEDCSPLATVSPGERWETKLPVVHVEGPAVGSACLAAQLEGQPFGPVCEVELNTRPLGFRDLNYLFIDGLPTATEENSDGSVLRVLPGLFPYGVSR